MTHVTLGPVAVLAGTPVDTRMGTAFLGARGLTALPFPISANPWEQTAFQYAPAEDRHRRVGQVLEQALRRGCGRALVYCNSLSGIEQVLLEANPRLNLLGACALQAVLDVEAGVPPEELVERRRLAELAGWFDGCGAEALVLGCTHFPYFKEALAARTTLPLVDPADEMLRLLTAL